MTPCMGKINIAFASGNWH